MFIYEREKSLVSDKNSKKFFNFVKHKTQASPKIGPLKTANGDCIIEDKAMANIFLQHFKNFTKSDSLVPYCSLKTIAYFDIDIVLPHEIEQICMRLPSKTSLTPDKIPPVFIKNIATCHIVKFWGVYPPLAEWITGLVFTNRE